MIVRSDRTMVHWGGVQATAAPNSNPSELDALTARTVALGGDRVVDAVCGMSSVVCVVEWSAARLARKASQSSSSSTTTTIRSRSRSRSQTQQTSAESDAVLIEQQMKQQQEQQRVDNVNETLSKIMGSNDDLLVDDAINSQDRGTDHSSTSTSTIETTSTTTSTASTTDDQSRKQPRNDNDDDDGANIDNKHQDAEEKKAKLERLTHSVMSDVDSDDESNAVAKAANANIDPNATIHAVRCVIYCIYILHN